MIQRILVVGAGFMGSGIAQVAAQHNYIVFFYDIESQYTESGLININMSLAKQVKKGRITNNEKQSILNNIVPIQDLIKANECDLVIEAIVENKTIKGEVFTELDQICKKTTIFASNTSSIPITDLAAFTKRPNRFIGMHFFSPAPVMKLIEVITGFRTSEETFQTVKKFVESIGKEPVRVKDGPGFLVNRINNAMRLEAYKCLVEGVASIEDIDKAMRIGLGHTMGPFEQNDFTGLDVGLDVIETLWHNFGDSKWCPPVVLKKLVVSGDLGRKTGCGWYDYSDDVKKPRTDIEF